MGKCIDAMECFTGALLDIWQYNKQLNVSLIDLVWEHSIDASVTFGTHSVCVCDIDNKPKCSIM